MSDFPKSRALKVSNASNRGLRFFRIEFALLLQKLVCVCRCLSSTLCIRTAVSWIPLLEVSEGFLWASRACSGPTVIEGISCWDFEEPPFKSGTSLGVFFAQESVHVLLVLALSQSLMASMASVFLSASRFTLSSRAERSSARMSACSFRTSICFIRSSG